MYSNTNMLRIKDIRVQRGDSGSSLQIEWSYPASSEVSYYQVEILSKSSEREVSTFDAGQKEMFELTFTNSRFVSDSKIQVKAVLKDMVSVHVASDIIDVMEFIMGVSSSPTASPLAPQTNLSILERLRNPSPLSPPHSNGSQLRTIEEIRNRNGSFGSHNSASVSSSHGNNDVNSGNSNVMSQRSIDAFNALSLECGSNNDNYGLFPSQQQQIQSNHQNPSLGFGYDSFEKIMNPLSLSTTSNVNGSSASSSFKMNNDKMVTSTSANSASSTHDSLVNALNSIPLSSTPTDNTPSLAHIGVASEVETSSVGSAFNNSVCEDKTEETNKKKSKSDGLEEILKMSFSSSFASNRSVNSSSRSPTLQSPMLAPHRMSPSQFGSGNTSTMGTGYPSVASRREVSMDNFARGHGYHHQNQQQPSSLGFNLQQHHQQHSSVAYGQPSPYQHLHHQGSPERELQDHTDRIANQLSSLQRQLNDMLPPKAPLSRKSGSMNSPMMSNAPSPMSTDRALMQSGHGSLNSMGSFNSQGTFIAADGTILPTGSYPSPGMPYNSLRSMGSLHSMGSINSMLPMTHNHQNHHHGYPHGHHHTAYTDHMNAHSGSYSRNHSFEQFRDSDINVAPLHTLNFSSSFGEDAVRAANLEECLMGYRPKHLKRATTHVCHVCKLYCTSLKQFTAHCEGRKHTIRCEIVLVKLRMADRTIPPAFTELLAFSDSTRQLLN